MQVLLDAAQVANVERLQAERGFASPDETVRWLLDVAFEAVSGGGRRFWDRRIPGEPPAD